MTLSRRRLLQTSLAILPGAVAAQAVSRWLPGVGGGVASAAEAAAGTPADETRWAFVCDTTRCIGCGMCVEACKLENHVPMDPEFNRTWVERHVIASDG